VRVISLEDLRATMPGATDDEVAAQHARIVAEAIARDEAEYAAAEAELRTGRLTGALCSCCDKPLPAGSPGPDCAECAELTT
jgi:hypothetical protein